MWELTTENAAGYLRERGYHMADVPDEELTALRERIGAALAAGHVAVAVDLCREYLHHRPDHARTWFVTASNRASSIFSR